MAMIKCPECGKDISDKAVSCPNCGYPLHEFPNRVNDFEKDLDYDNEENYCDDECDEDEVSTDGAKHIYECICTCLNCGNKYSYNNIDVSKNKQGRWEDFASAYSAIGGSNIEKSISYNHQKQSYTMDFNKCPKCGSRKIQKEYEDYYINSSGEYLEGYEPSFFDKVSEFIGSTFNFIGDFAFKGCLIISLIPLLFLIYAIFKIISIFF